MKFPRLDSDPPEAWRWWAYIFHFFLFLIVFHPWWLGIRCLAVYSLLMVLLLRKKSQIQSTPPPSSKKAQVPVNALTGEVIFNCPAGRTAVW